MTECDKCKLYLKSLEKKVISCYHVFYFYPGMPATSVYCRPILIWGIANRDSLNSGTWPAEPSDTDQRDLGNSKRINPNAHFIPAIDLYSEITYRLKTVSRDAREALEGEIDEGWDYTRFTPPAKRAFNYISIRRKQTYSQWVAGRKYKEKVK